MRNKKIFSMLFKKFWSIILQILIDFIYSAYKRKNIVKKVVTSYTICKRNVTILSTIYRDWLFNFGFYIIIEIIVWLFDSWLNIIILLIAWFFFFKSLAYMFWFIFLTKLLWKILKCTLCFKPFRKKFQAFSSKYEILYPLFYFSIKFQNFKPILWKTKKIELRLLSMLKGILDNKKYIKIINFENEDFLFYFTFQRGLKNN